MHRILATSAMVVLLAADLAGQSSPLPAWGNAERGLRLGILATARSGRDVTFEIVVENVGPEDFVLRLGSMLANGKVMWPEAIQLDLTNPAGTTTRVEWVDRRHGVVAGRRDDFRRAARRDAQATRAPICPRGWRTPS